MEAIKPYRKGCGYSYTLGAFPTYELLKAKPETAVEIIIHSSFTDASELKKLCDSVNVPFSINDRQINRLSDKENVFVIGVFRPFTEALSKTDRHLCLVNPGNMGNLGTIMRTAAGFSYTDLAIIGNGADVFNPKTVRASMGAVFRIRHEVFPDFESYKKRFPEHDIYTFMLDGDTTLKLDNVQPKTPYTLVFGNEATGLAPEYKTCGRSVFIPQSEMVDSLNLTIAAGIGMYVFGIRSEA